MNGENVNNVDIAESMGELKASQTLKLARPLLTLDVLLEQARGTVCSQARCSPQ